MPGITFDENGVCKACNDFDNRITVDWQDRSKQLKDLCEFYKCHNGQEYYDCMIAVSGGKDSYYQINLFKNILDMNPICFMVDNLSWTKIGRANFYNMCEEFGVDILTFTPNRDVLKFMMMSDFLTELHPNKYWDELLYDKPLEFAHMLGIKLLIWGENADRETGGENSDDVQTADHLTKKSNHSDLVETIFTSYFVKWSRYENVELAHVFGFKGFNDRVEIKEIVLGKEQITIEEREWEREGFIDIFHTEQVDTIGYLVNSYCKFIKFGFGLMTELCSDAIRHGKMTREEAIKVVNEEDWKLDKKMLNDFCKCIEITTERFWEIIDGHANKSLLKKWHGSWRLINEAK